MKIKSVLFIPVLLMLIAPGLYGQQLNTGASMSDPYTKPMVEEAPRNIILQNRCGNRATMLFFDDRTELQVVYKPNAFRRKDYRARNFSNRDNYTGLFEQFRLPQLNVDYIDDWKYDPFITELGFRTPWDAKGNIKMINIADENAFALVSRAPLLITIKPHQSFRVEDGLLTEAFTDRGEEIVSFVHFSGFEENRFRVTTSGEYVLQVFENEVLLFGGEENMTQVHRLIEKLDGMDHRALLARNEKLLEPVVSNALIRFNEDDFQEVLDLNRRIIYSGIDAGGACFGAINRIYYLIWVRDGSMTSSQMARAGNPEMINVWTPFLMNNPNILTNDQGEKIPGYQQIVGTRWTKNEDDGVYYATLSMFTYLETTGKTDLLNGPEFDLLMEVIDHYLEDVWDEEKEMVLSDTRGETPLKSNPYFGYDVVNGNFEINDHHLKENQKVLSVTGSLYNQVNTFNLLKMARIMMAQRSVDDGERSARYAEIEEAITRTLRTRFATGEQTLYAEYQEYEDGSVYWQPFARGADYWEYAWAVSTGPFFPVPALQLNAARMVPEKWPKIRTYGYCPWNTLSRILYEYGMSSDDYVKMLSDEVNEAMVLSQKYPMKGALTEYYTAVESWRGLPFSASSFYFSTTAQAMQSMPMGIGIRASENVDTLLNFRFRLSSFDVFAAGKGDEVGEVRLNGEEIPFSLQVPDSRMRIGKNEVIVGRTSNYKGFRLYSSSARLLDLETAPGEVVYRMWSPASAELVFENPGLARVTIAGPGGADVPFSITKLPGTGMHHLLVEAQGDFTVRAELKE